MPVHREAIQKLAKMIEDIDFAMLTTVQPDGTLRSRPMSTQRAEFDGTLWFFTLGLLGIGWLVRTITVSPKFVRYMAKGIDLKPGSKAAVRFWTRLAGAMVDEGLLPSPQATPQPQAAPAPTPSMTPRP